jgi:hypothetical protein
LNVASLTVAGVRVTGLTSSGRTQNKLYATPTPVARVELGGLLTADKLHVTQDNNTGYTVIDTLVYATPGGSGDWQYNYPVPFFEKPVLVLTPGQGGVLPLLSQSTETGCDGVIRFVSDLNPNFVLSASGKSAQGDTLFTFSAGDTTNQDAYVAGASSLQLQFGLASGNVPGDYATGQIATAWLQNAFLDPNGIWDGSCANGNCPTMTVSVWLLKNADGLQLPVKVGEWPNWPTGSAGTGETSTTAFNQDLYLPITVESGVSYKVFFQLDWDTGTYGGIANAIPSNTLSSTGLVGMYYLPAITETTPLARTAPKAKAPAKAPKAKAPAPAPAPAPAKKLQTVVINGKVIQRVM